MFSKVIESFLATVILGISIASGQTSQSIDFPAIADRTFGDPDFELVATASSGLPVEFSILSGRATISGTTLTVTGGGLVIVQADQPGDASYDPAIPEQQSFEVARLPITVSLADLEHVYDGTPKSASAITDPPGASTVLTYNFTTIPPTLGGTHTVVATVVDFRYTGSASGTMTIAKIGQQITFPALDDRPFAGPPTPLNATSSSGLPVRFEIAAGNAALGGDIRQTTVRPTLPGIVTIVAKQTGSRNYLPALEVTQSFVVAKSPQTITFPPIPTQTFGTAPFAPTASTSSDLIVTFEVLAGPAVMSGGLLTITGTGSVSLRAIQPGDSRWETAPSLEQTFTVEKSPQVIDFPSVADRQFDSDDFVVSATSDSTLPVAFQIVSGPATVTGSTLTITGAGDITVMASQPGNENYLAAAPTTQSFVAGFSLSLESTNGGAIIPLPLKGIYRLDDVVTLTGDESAGYRFTGWENALTGSQSPANLTMNEHQTVRAEFTEIWTLDVTPGANGDVNIAPEKNEYLDGDIITLTPIPDLGYELASWSGDASGDTSPLTFTLSSDTAISASFVDTAAPSVTILSPAEGDTNNQFTTLLGTVDDNDTVSSVHWQRDGIPMGELGITGSSFSVDGLTLAPGSNVFTVFAVDPQGNEGSSQSTINWLPDRTISLGSPAEAREGKLIDLPLSLNSSGNVRVMSFVIGYDAQLLAEPTVQLTGAVAQGINQIDTATDGEVRITLAPPTNTFPNGELPLGVLTFRTRSVPFDLSTELTVTPVDISDTEGNQITVGTHTSGASARINQREFTGDINTNDRLDTGDAFLMQQMLSGKSDIRSWDHPLNDLNGSSLLNFGDVFRVLRTVVGIDEQPAPSPTTGGTSPNYLGPLAKIVMDRNHGTDGDEIHLSVVIEQLTHSPGGASFTLDYPVEALRLTDASSHIAGALVPGTSLVLWNVAPEENNYANQTGQISFVASDSTPWTVNGNSGVLAEFTFKTTPAAATQTLWNFNLHSIELPTSGGFDVLELPESSATFIGQPTSYGDWMNSFLSAQQQEDPALTAPDADPDGDGANNLIEYSVGSNPTLPRGRRQTRGLIVYEADTPYPAIEFYQSLTAVDLVADIEFSSDLNDWTAADETSSLLHTRELTAGGLSERVVVRSQTPITNGSIQRQFRVRFSLVPDN